MKCTAQLQGKQAFFWAFWPKLNWQKTQKNSIFWHFSAKTQYFSETQPICYKFYFIKNQKKAKKISKNSLKMRKTQFLTTFVAKQSQKTPPKKACFSLFAKKLSARNPKTHCIYFGKTHWKIKKLRLPRFLSYDFRHYKFFYQLLSFKDCTIAQRT